MKRFIAGFCALAMGAAVLTSCLGDDDNTTTTLYSDVAITGFTLGTLNRYTHTTSASTGNDTIVKTTITGSYYDMTIDHLAGRIYNQKPLPVGTDVEHVVCTITTKNSGVVALQSATSDSLKWHSDTDSIDFTTDRIFIVYSSDGTSQRNYTVQVNVSSSQGTAFGWQLVKADEQWAAWDGKQLVAAEDSVMLAECDGTLGSSSNELYSMDANGHLQYSLDGGNSWQDEQLDDDEALLPQAEKTALVSWAYAPADHTDYVLMVGTPRQADVNYMRVWRKIVSTTGGGQWVHMLSDDTNHYPMPRQEWITMTCYEGTVLAVGSDMVLRQSRDQGISWRTSDTYALPETLTGTRVTMTTDTQGRLWLLTDTGQLWRGDTSN